MARRRTKPTLNLPQLLGFGRVLPLVIEVELERNILRRRPFSIFVETLRLLPQSALPTFVPT